MVIDVVFKFCNILDGREARKHKRVSQAKSARKETIRIELTIAFSYLNIKAMSYIYQFSITLKFMQSR